MIEYEVQMYRRPATLRKAIPTTESVETIITAYVICHLLAVSGLSILQVRNDGMEWKYYTVAVETAGYHLIVSLDLVTEEEAKRVLIKSGGDN